MGFFCCPAGIVVARPAGVKSGVSSFAGNRYLRLEPPRAYCTCFRGAKLSETPSSREIGTGTSTGTPVENGESLWTTVSSVPRLETIGLQRFHVGWATESATAGRRFARLL